MSHELDEVLEEAGRGEAAPLYLLWGEEFLIRKGAEELIARLLPDPSPGLNYAVMDAAAPREVAAELATLPLFPGRKIVLARDPDFLAPRKARGDALGKVRDAWAAGRRKEAARRLLGLAARAGWGVAELEVGEQGRPSADAWREELNVELSDADPTLFREIAALCREERISAPDGDAGALLELFHKGLPQGQILVVATSELDAKHPLVKLAKERGRFIERKVAAKLKDLDLSELIASVLGPRKKRLARDAEQALKDRCGGNMRLVQSELEKLALYVDAQTIQLSDVELLVGRAREEEYLELSDALHKRDFQAALKYAHAAMDQGAHPLMLMGAVASIVRQLLDGSDRLARHAGGSMPRSFDEFKAKVFSKVAAELEADGARVPHPYGAFLGMQAAARHGRPDLLAALVACADADVALKSGGGALEIERLIAIVCGRLKDTQPRVFRLV